MLPRYVTVLYRLFLEHLPNDFFFLEYVKYMKKYMYVYFKTTANVSEATGSLEHLVFSKLYLSKKDLIARSVISLHLPWEPPSGGSSTSNCDIFESHSMNVRPVSLFIYGK
jgi:hypothetical protein